MRPLVLELSTLSELLFASKCLRLHADARTTGLSREANVSLITPLIGYARIRHLLPTLLHPPRSLDSVQPEPAAATGGPAHRLRAATWMNGRTALGACLVLLAVLAGALFLDRSQRLAPCTR